MRLAPRLSTLTAAVGLALGGCATSGVSMHRMPPETPAADNAAAIKKAAALAATAREAAQSKPQNADTQPLTAADAPSPRTYDPWERLNRLSYRFNARLDEAIVLPVTQGYRWIPSPIRTGIHNMLDNLSEVDSIVNYSLQGRLRYAVKSLGRFAINSTVGIAGLFDVAAHAKLPFAPTGFGTTLAWWGMHPGPFLVIPFFGPSTLREAVGLLGDYGTDYGIDLFDIYRGDPSWGVGLVDAVDERANINFRYYSTGSPFEYETIRFLYVRKLLLSDAGLHPAEKPKKRDEAIPAGR